MTQSQSGPAQEAVQPVLFSHPDGESPEAAPREQRGAVAAPSFVPSLTPLGDGWAEQAPAWRPARPSAGRGAPRGRDDRRGQGDQRGRGGSHGRGDLPGGDGHPGHGGSGHGGGDRRGQARNQSRGRANGWGRAG
ncbi:MULTISPECIES: hypothetical protein [Actinosynnema]|uniref:hypothetical protein n=1 Tax=Actinosynnema TaxID=40566 RepID=UPI0020A382D6|nr:hypothetical protein [Actinosynnema pretiosum]MCP2098422.1 hypothetical protein [Actinosynnema pretiosum]